MSNLALGNPGNYTLGGMRFYFAENDTSHVAEAITAVDNATPGSTTVTIGSDESTLLGPIGFGAQITITGSTGNDGTYDVIAVATVAATSTTFTTSPDLPDNTLDGNLAIVRKGELYLGNVVTGSFTSDITFLDHFTAKSGTRSKDRSIVQEIAVTANMTMDEPNVDNMNFFMLGGDITTVAGTPASRRFAPYTNTERSGGCRIAGVSDTGNEWVWTVYYCTLKPDGDFTYDDQDWSQFSFVLEVLSDSANHASAPFGVIDHYGIDEDIDLSLPLPDNS